MGDQNRGGIMAKVNFTIDDGFFEMLEHLENADEVVPQVLEACAPILIEEEKKELQRHRRSGSLINSIKSTGVKKNDWGHYLVVRPTGKDKFGQRNMEKFIFSEYGTSKQKADPIQKNIAIITEARILEKAQEAFNEVMSKYEH